MGKVLRWTGYSLGALLLVLLLAAALLWYLSSAKLNARPVPAPERLAAPTPAELADGPRRLNVLGCISCHGDGLRGKTMFDEPMVARLHAPNLTLLAERASDEQLARAIRQGIGVDGRAMVVMPSAQLSRLSDGEVAALIAAIRALPVGGQQLGPIELGPLGRFGVLNGKVPLQPDLVAAYRQRLPADLGPEHAQGRHLAMIGCSECHGPTLGGGEPEPGLKAPDLTMVGAYDLAAFTKLMRTGLPPDGRKLKLMDQVSRKGMSHLTDAEISALHAYLVERANRAP